jgi:hemerythrin-like metal-binding protein
MQPFRDPQVDAEHDWIISFFETLREREPRGGDPALDAELARGLLSYLDRHCSREEALMRRNGYAEAEDHRLAHVILRKEFRRLLLPRLQGHLALDEDIRLVRGLFLRHIVTWDEAYGDWLGQRAAS